MCSVDILIKINNVRHITERGKIRRCNSGKIALQKKEEQNRFAYLSGFYSSNIVNFDFVRDLLSSHNKLMGF